MKQFCRGEEAFETSSWCLAVVFFESILIGDSTLCTLLPSYIDRKFALQAVCLTKLPA